MGSASKGSHTVCEQSFAPLGDCFPSSRWSSIVCARSTIVVGFYQKLYHLFRTRLQSLVESQARWPQWRIAPAMSCIRDDHRNVLHFALSGPSNNTVRCLWRRHLPVMLCPMDPFFKKCHASSGFFCPASDVYRCSPVCTMRPKIITPNCEHTPLLFPNWCLFHL
jgi:hypothetical protein